MDTKNDALDDNVSAFKEMDLGSYVKFQGCSIDLDLAYFLIFFRLR